MANKAPTSQLDSSSDHRESAPKLPYCMNVAEAGAFLGIHPRTLNNWRSQKRGPTYAKMGGRVVYRIEDLEAYIAICLVEGR